MAISKQNNNRMALIAGASEQKPDAYALKIDARDKRISRREFISTAAAGVAMIGLGGCSRQTISSPDKSPAASPPTPPPVSSSTPPPAAVAIRARMCKPLLAHDLTVNCLAFSPDSRSLASGSDDCTVKLWRVADGALVKT
jgi:hypothetical protein